MAVLGSRTSLHEVFASRFLILFHIWLHFHVATAHILVELTTSLGWLVFSHRPSADSAEASPKKKQANRRNVSATLWQASCRFAGLAMTGAMTYFKV